MSLSVRTSVRVLLFNEKGELLMMCAHDPKTTTADGEYRGRFWFPIGGEIEPNESLQEAALREIYEEAGLTEKEIELGPTVWFGAFDLVLNGTPTHLKQTFIVAKTKQAKVAFTELDQWEQRVAVEIAWFSLEAIKNCDETIYPRRLSEYLPPIIAGNYPAEPLELDLS